MSVKNIMNEVEGLIWNTIKSCAAVYGFSAEEARAKIDLNGNLISVVKENVEKETLKAEKLRLKEADKLAKEAEKAEKLRLKEAEKALKEADKLAKEAEKAEKLRLKEAEKALKEAEKANESSERSAMKDQDIASKAAEKLALKEANKLAKEAEKPKKTKKEKKVVAVQPKDDESIASTVLMTDSEDEEPYVRFQNIPLMNEINSIRDVKKFKNWKKLSRGVKLARQILDI